MTSRMLLNRARHKMQHKLNSRRVLRIRIWFALNSGVRFTFVRLLPSFQQICIFANTMCSGYHAIAKCILVLRPSSTPTNYTSVFQPDWVALDVIQLPGAQCVAAFKHSQLIIHLCSSLIEWLWMSYSCQVHTCVPALMHSKYTFHSVFMQLTITTHNCVPGLMQRTLRQTCSEPSPPAETAVRYCRQDNAALFPYVFIPLLWLVAFWRHAASGQTSCKDSLFTHVVPDFARHSASLMIFYPVQIAGISDVQSLSAVPVYFFLFEVLLGPVFWILSFAEEIWPIKNHKYTTYQRFDTLYSLVLGVKQTYNNFPTMHSFYAFCVKNTYKYIGTYCISRNTCTDGPNTELVPHTHVCYINTLNPETIH
jgi:hypothetical protein